MTSGKQEFVALGDFSNRNVGGLDKFFDPGAGTMFRRPTMFGIRGVQFFVVVSASKFLFFGYLSACGQGNIFLRYILTGTRGYVNLLLASTKCL